MSQTVAANGPKAQPSMLSRMLAVREFGSFAALILMVVMIAVSIPQFRQVENLINVTRKFFLCRDCSHGDDSSDLDRRHRSFGWLGMGDDRCVSGLANV